MTNGNSIVKTEYLDGFQYVDEKLEFFPTAEGYVKATPIGLANVYVYNYVYNYTDHLGNIRLSYTKDPNTGELEVLEENHYYPFGLKHPKYSGGFNLAHLLNPYKYKYNGKEFQDELNLNTYAYGWRDYDPAIARFNRIDRFAEKYPNASPYNYAGNNPMRFIDIKGDSIWINFGKDNESRVLYQNGQLLNADGSAYTGDGVKIKKDGSTRITNSFLKQSVKALNKLGGTKTGGEMLSALQGSNYSFDIKSASYNPNEDGAVNEFVPDGVNAYFFNAPNDEDSQSMLTGIGSGGTIYWNPTDETVGTLNVVGGMDFNPTTNLGHELAHAWDANYGLLNRANQQINGLRTREWRASYVENQIRGQLGAPLRSTYNTTNLLDSKNNPLRVSGAGTPTVDSFIRYYSIQNVR